MLNVSDEPMNSVIDFAVLEELEESVADGIPEIMVELFDTYLEDSHGHLQKIATAIADKDKRQLELSAHSLKSSSATFGANSLSRLFARIESLAREGQIEESRVLFERARQEFERVEQALREERKKRVNKQGS